MFKNINFYRSGSTITKSFVITSGNEIKQVTPKRNTQFCCNFTQLSV